MINTSVQHPVAVCEISSLVVSPEILATWSTGYEKWMQHEPQREGDV